MRQDRSNCVWHVPAGAEPIPCGVLAMVQALVVSRDWLQRWLYSGALLACGVWRRIST